MTDKTANLEVGAPVDAASSSTAPGLRSAPQPWLTNLDQVVGGGEIVLLAIKPSLWRPILELAPWLVGCLLIGCTLVLVDRPAAGLSMGATVQLVALVAFTPLAVAFVRWVSTWYVLTNRRIIDVTGVLEPRMWACPLVDVRNTYVNASLLERPARLGTIVFATDRPDQPPHQWRFVVSANAVHAEIRHAIENALDQQG